MAQIEDFEMFRGKVGEGARDSVFENVEFNEIGQSCYMPGYGSLECVVYHYDFFEFGECAERIWDCPRKVCAGDEDGGNVFVGMIAFNVFPVACILVIFLPPIFVSCPCLSFVSLDQRQQDI